MSRRMRAIGLFMSIGLLLAACTSDSGESAGESEPAEESAAAESQPAAESEAPAADLEDTLTVLCTPQEDWPPAAEPPEGARTLTSRTPLLAVVAGETPATV